MRGIWQPSRLPLHFRLTKGFISCEEQTRWREPRFANRRGILLARTEEFHEARQPTSQGLRKGLIVAQSLLLQPQAQDDERVGRPARVCCQIARRAGRPRASATCSSRTCAL